MKRRWPAIIGYVLVVLVQALLLVAAYMADVLSRERMMFMRYLFAKNVALESSVFSTTGRIVQVAALVAIGLALGVLAARARRPRGGFASVQAVLGMLLAGGAAALLALVSPGERVAVYAVVAALWAALVLQIGVIAAAWRQTWGER